MLLSWATSKKLPTCHWLWKISVHPSFFPSRAIIRSLSHPSTRSRWPTLGRGFGDRHVSLPKHTGGHGLGNLHGSGDRHATCSPAPAVPHRSISGPASGAPHAWDALDVEHTEEEELDAVCPPGGSPAPSTASPSANEPDRRAPLSNHYQIRWLAAALPWAGVALPPSLWRCS